MASVDCVSLSRLNNFKIGAINYLFERIFNFYSYFLYVMLFFSKRTDRSLIFKRCKIT